MTVIGTMGESKLLPEKPFWMVLGAGEPRHRHETLDSADREARRLARANPGQAFVVLRSISAHVVASLQSKSYPFAPGVDDDIPF